MPKLAFQNHSVYNLYANEENKEDLSLSKIMKAQMRKIRYNRERK